MLESTTAVGGDEVEPGTSRADALELARSIYGVWLIQTQMGQRPQARLQQVAELKGLTIPQTRRYLALHLAPSEIQDHYVAGRLAAKTVELLQGLAVSKQLELAHQLIDAQATTFHAQQQIAIAQSGEPRPPKVPVDEGLAFEQALLRSAELVDPYLEMTPRKLQSVFHALGSAITRRSLVGMIRDQIELLLSLKQALEYPRGLRDRRPDGSSAERAAVGAAGDSS